MAANKQQGSTLTLFWTAITVLCAGMAYYSSGLGKLLLLVGLVGVIASLMGFAKIKGLEGDVPGLPGSAALKLAGILITWLGWLVTVMGLHVTASVGGRLVFALAGIGISLYGILGVLTTAFGRKAVGRF